MKGTNVMKLVLHVLLVGILTAVMARGAAAQTTPGTPPFQSFSPGPVDVVNVATGNTHVTIPIFHKDGRGLPIDISLTYDTGLWAGPGAWSTPTYPSQWFGWYLEPIGFAALSGSEVTCLQYGQNGQVSGAAGLATYSGFDPGGTPHPSAASVISAWGTCPYNGQYNFTAYVPGVATDGSGYTITPAPSNVVVLTDKHGRQVSITSLNTLFAPGTETDTNGNQVSVNSSGAITDTLGQNVLTEAGSGTPASPVTLTYKDPNGNPATWTIKFTALTVRTNFGCAGVYEYGPTSQNLVTEIDLPDQSTNPSDKYTFTYESTPSYAGDVTARLASMTLPTGGTIYYTYSGGNNGIACSTAWGPVVGSIPVFTRETPDGTWTYAHVYNSSTTTITDPLGNQTLVHFPTQSEYETERDVYQGSSGSGTLLETVYTCYNGAAPPCTGGGSLPFTQKTIFTKWGNGQEFETNILYDLESQNNVPYSYGLIKEQDDYDYGNGGPGLLLRKTITNYATLTENIANDGSATNAIADRPSQVSVYDGSSNLQAQTTYTYDGSSLSPSGVATQHISMTGSRGNPTAITKLVTGSSTVTENRIYFDTGMTQTVTDPKGNATQYSYSSTYAGAYPTTVTNALSQPTNYTYDINSGLVTSIEDPNNQTTSYSYDTMFRPLTLSYPDRGLTSYLYGTQYGGTFTKKTEEMDSSGDQRVTYTWFDDLGRKARMAVTSGESQPYDETLNTCFNSLGLVSLQGYPFQDGGWNNPISCSVAGDSYTDASGHPAYDALGRPTRITHADGSYGTMSYSANCTTATDEQGKSREVCTDGLGRVMSVAEDPGVSPHLNYTTTYGYDALNNLTSVVQGSETRTFAYDGLSRLTSAANPESGTTLYTYDADSNVLTRLDARNITTTYSYDVLNRLTQKSYSDGTTPAADYYYDSMPWWWGSIGTSNPIGRLTAEGVSNGSSWLSVSWFAYDAMGRFTGNPQSVSGNNYSLVYGYDLIGDITSYTDALGESYTQIFNAAGLPTQLTSSWNDSLHPPTLVSGVHYNGAGSPTVYTLGNGLMETTAYNGLLQPCRMNVNSSGTQVSSCTGTPPSGNLLDLTTGFNYGTGDNGNVMSWASAGQQTFNRSYSYDGVNRIATMSAPGSMCSGLSWSYDQWGNRTDQTVTGGTCGSSQLTFNSYNHVTNSGFQYDAAGNMTHDASHSYAYDAENRITAVDGGSTATYVYDAQGRRVQKTAGATQTEYLYDLSGNVISEAPPSGWLNIYLRLGGMLVAEYSAGDPTRFIHIDHLGSVRLITGYPTPTVVDSMDYLPSGEQIAGGSTTTHKFTGKERDSESGLDNFGARYMSSQFGRFMSPDPSNQSVDFELPQTWNRYSYVLNNPLNMVDRNGQWPSYTHESIVNDAFPGMSASDLQTLYNASKEVDTHQEAYNSWMHGMSDGTDPNRAEAIYVAMQLGDQQITKDEAEARLDQAKWVAEGHSGLSPTALMKFGNALHIITDRLSPAHTGYQPWYGQSKLNPSSWAHWLHEMNGWLYPNQYNASVQAAQNAFQQTFGMGWDEFDLMQLQQPQRACVTTDDGLGNVTTTCN